MKGQIETIKNNFTKRGFVFNYFETCEEGIDFIKSIIPEGSSIGFGGSVTVKESGLLSALQESNDTLYHGDFYPKDYKETLLKKMHESDWYIASANALCESGDIVNVDGRGNRVAEMLHGPKNVIFLCGVNKLVDSIQSGIDRVHNVASPKNCVRLNKKTPCAITGKCNRCNSPDTICRATVIHHHPTTGKNVYIVLINKNLGY